MCLDLFLEAPTPDKLIRFLFAAQRNEKGQCSSVHTPSISSTPATGTSSGAPTIGSTKNPVGLAYTGLKEPRWQCFSLFKLGIKLKVFFLGCTS
jgi:hypothetical protein